MRSAIQLYTGTVFDPLNPDPALIDIRDIAHNLSTIVRFSGCVDPWYSVAQHSLEVAKRVPPEYRLRALLHDGSEGLGLVDMASPLKAHPEFGRLYREFESVVQDAIADRYGLPRGFANDPVVKEVDVRMLETERLQLLGHADDPAIIELWEPWTGGYEPYDVHLSSMPPLGAEISFLSLFDVLTEGAFSE